MKNQFKHTPGPWIFSGETSSLFGHVKIGTHKLTINTPAESRERIANAKLIAAAPELLEEIIRLRKIILFLEGYTEGKCDPTDLAKTNELIKKATE